MGSVMGSGLLEEVPLNQDEGVNSRVREAGRILEMGSAEVAARNGPQNWFPLAHPFVCGGQWGIGCGNGMDGSAGVSGQKGTLVFMF